MQNDMEHESMYGAKNNIAMTEIKTLTFDSNAWVELLMEIVVQDYNFCFVCFSEFVCEKMNQY